MNARRWWAAFWLIALCLASGLVAANVPTPPLKARVTDLTGTLTVAQRADLEQRLAALERDKGAQIAVLLLPTTQPETIEEFGIRLAESWKIGRRGIDDGVIVIVAKDDRAVRIEVGYGLEGAIPDAVAKRIIEELIVPRFRRGDFHGGLQSAIDALASLIAGETLPPATQQSGGGKTDDLSALLFFVILASGFLRLLLGLLGSLMAAGLAGFFAWWLFGSWLAAFVAALLAFLFSFMRSGRGGWHAGGGGFSRGGGGFSGGGGGFGGGGASGRW